MEEYIVKLIREIENRKREQHIEPIYALDIDLFNSMNDDLRQELNKMYKDGKISVSSSLNNKIIRLK